MSHWKEMKSMREPGIPPQARCILTEFCSDKDIENIVGHWFPQGTHRMRCAGRWEGGKGSWGSSTARGALGLLGLLQMQVQKTRFNHVKEQRKGEKQEDSCWNLAQLRKKVPVLDKEFPSKLISGHQQCPAQGTGRHFWERSLSSGFGAQRHLGFVRAPWGSRALQLATANSKQLQSCIHGKLMPFFPPFFFFEQKENQCGEELGESEHSSHWAALRISSLGMFSRSEAAAQVLVCVATLSLSVSPF